MSLSFELLCGGRGNVTTIVNGRRNDPLAKLITCKKCKRIWNKEAR